MTRASWKDFNVEREWLGKSFNLSEVTAMRTGRQAKMRTQDINGQKLYVNYLTKTIWDRMEGEVVLNIGDQRTWQSETSSDLSTIIPLIHPFKISIWHHSHCEQTWNFLQQQCSKVCCVWGTGNGEAKQEQEKLQITKPCFLSPGNFANVALG